MSDEAVYMICRTAICISILLYLAVLVGGWPWKPKQ
jgi:hypothetical protein